METVLATFVLVALVIAGMAVGVIFSNRSLRGSCGGTGRACSCTEEARRECALAAHHEPD